MDILYVTQFYYPENIAAAFRAFEHANYWREWGNDVTVYTGLPNYPSRRLYPGYKKQMFHREVIEGNRVYRNKEYIGANTNLFKRALNTGSFLLFGLINWYRHKEEIQNNIDLVFASSGTIFAGLLGYIIAKSIACPFVIEFRDLTFIQLLATGSSPSSLKVNLVKKIELFLARKANHSVVVTYGLKSDLVQEDIVASSISVIPNGADIVPLEHVQSDCLQLGYYGTIGISQNVSQTIDCLQSAVQTGIELRYEIIGEGAEKDKVRDWVCANGSEWISLRDGISKVDLEQHYETADMTVVSLVNNDNFKESIPSKIFQSLARGVPVLFFGPYGEAARLIDENNVGLVLCSSFEDNCNKFLEFFSSSNYQELLAEMRLNAITLMEKNYTREKMAELLIEVFNNTLSAYSE